ncbi:MAG: hypothetical protein PHY92_03370 [Alphaproteobacteria bacterium]|nr:hypothetical protein [Alphaproteobacteria bacterium]
MNTGNANLKDARTEIEPVLNSLLATDTSNSKTVREALTGFYNTVQETREKAHAGSEPDPVVQTVTEVITEKLEVAFVKAFKNAAPILPGNEEARKEVERFRALTRAFNALGPAMDALDHIRAKEGGDPDYHNNGHNLLVMAIRMVRDQKKWSTQGRPATVKEINGHLRDLIAAAAHDFGHDGTNNSFSGEYVPGKLELASYAFLEPCLKGAGMAQEDCDFIKWQIFATDPALPGEIARYAFYEHFLDNTYVLPYSEIEKQTDALPEESQKLVREFFAALENNADLAEAAMALKGADMVPSYGLGLDFWKTQTGLFNDEFVSTVGGKPLIDDRREPIPASQEYVCLHFLKTQFCKASEEVCAELKVGFDDPHLEYMFGNSARLIEKVAEDRAPKEAVRGLRETYTNGYQPLGIGLGSH